MLGLTLTFPVCAFFKRLKLPSPDRPPSGFNFIFGDRIHRRRYRNFTRAAIKDGELISGRWWLLAFRELFKCIRIQHKAHR